MAHYTQTEILASLQDAHRRLEEQSSARHEPIAIIGMACRLPGAVLSPPDYWRLLRDGRSGIVKFTEEELRAADVAFERPDYVRVAAPLEDIEQFDIGFFGMHPQDLEVMDPQHRLLMQGVWEALEDAGYGAAEYRGTVGLFAGCSVNLYFLEQVIKNNGDFHGIENFQLATGNEKDYLVSKIAYHLNLTGPVVNVQSACSTSLVATHYAVQSLRLGECDIAIAGGATVKVPHRVGYLYKPDNIRSLQGECRAFDERADGTVEGNGMGLVVLKPLRSALRDRDHIYAVIRGSAVNNDGSDKVSFAAPSVSGQEQVIVRALQNAQVDPQTLQYFEAHGTGTRVGDPMEIAAASRAFRRWTDKTGFCALGSVKSNIGHADAAAGVAGLMKVALSLHHGQIPATLNFSAPNPALKLASSPFQMNTRLRPWPDCKIRRAAVSAFGIGGTNAHAVLEQAPDVPRTRHRRNDCVLPISAKSAAGLAANRLRLREYLVNHPQLDLADAAYTLSVGRKHFNHRCLVIARDMDDCIRQLADDGIQDELQICQTRRNVPVVFVFPGANREWAAEARDLYECEPAYRDGVDACLRAASEHLNLSVEEYLTARGAAAGSPGRDLCQFIGEYALAIFWRANGVEPHYVIGHGVGEYAAACVAEVVTLAEAMSMVVARSELIGDSVDAFKAVIGRIGFKPAKTLMLLNTRSRNGSAEAVPSAEYFASQLYEAAHFEAAAAKLLAEGDAVFVELGSRDVLEALRHRSGVPERDCIASLPAGGDVQSPSQSIHVALGRLWLAGAAIDWSKFNAGNECRRIPLPTYVFEKHRFWYERAPPGRVAEALARPASTPGPASQHFCYLPVWKRLPFVQQEAAATSRRCLLFSNRSPLAQSLEHALSGLGIPVVTVLAGTQFARQGAREYLMNPEDESDYHLLVADLKERDLVPDMMLHAWGLDATETVPSRGSFWSLCYFVRAWMRQGTAPLRAGIVSNGVENVSGSEPIVPERSLVLGACQAIRHELVGGQCRHFDSAFSATPSAHTLERVSNAIVRETLLSDPGVPRVAYRDGTRWLLDLEPLGLPTALPAPMRVREGGVYWITGGAGGIGLEVADYLTRQANVTVVLIQRSEFPPRSQWGAATTGTEGTSVNVLEKIQQMESRGSTVVLARADVSDAAALRKLYETSLQEYGGLHGVVHAAGIAGSGLLALKSRETIEQVLAPKVSGALAIHSVLGTHTLDFFVLCSSIIALTGGPGRSDYAAANCFLDAFAVERARCGDTAIVSINWDAWRETGMLADSRRRRVESRSERHARSIAPLLEKLVSDAGSATRRYCTHFDESTDWIARDHRIFGLPTLPGVTYIEMMAEALLREGSTLEIRDLEFIRPLALTSGAAEVFMQIHDDGAVNAIRIYSGDPQVLHAQASASVISHEERRVDIGQIAGRLSALELTGLSPVAETKPDGPLQFGPAWQIKVNSCHVGEREYLACLELPPTLRDDTGNYRLHVSLFDTATSYALRFVNPEELYLPVGYERLRIHGAMPTRIFSHVRFLTDSPTADILKFDVSLVAPDGREVAGIQNFAIKKIGGKAQARAVSAAVSPSTAGAPPMQQGEAGYGLATSTGVGVFGRVIAGVDFPQLVVSAQPLRELRVGVTVTAAAADLVTSSPVSDADTTILRPRGEVSTPYEPPADDMERQLALLWRSVLGIEPVGVNDDYVELGGDSLIATRLVDRIVAELNVTMSIVTLYERPTVRDLARYVRDALATAEEAGDREAALVGKGEARRAFLGRSEAQQAGRRTDSDSVANAP